MKKRHLIKFAGYFSTLAVVVVGFAPYLFKIPTVFHPWLLLASIVWIVIFSSGVLS